MKEYKKVLTIAGSDSGGGAGIQADIKAISACGCYAMSVITAVTAQNTVGVNGIHVIPAEMISAQITSVMEDIGVDAVKLGMLPTEESIILIARLLRKYQVTKVVLDPVMISTSGSQLVSSSAVEAIRTHLFPLATVITPNISETEYVTGLTIKSEADFSKAAMVMFQQRAQAILFKTGHLEGDMLTDYLFDNKDFICSYRYDRINTVNTHGTGCSLSSSIASYLALEYPLSKAIQLAEDYLHGAILSGSKYRFGHGHGPVHHFYKWWIK